ncbi:MAG: Hpt domain-containing protein [Rubrivivax sp.]|nr:Hpt domain-containing protein [Rubrivivax sp.]HOW49830.1 Hpt domain-containing protein [Rubrivivax sp.]HRY88395.1 Hpt domain-containing protein [Rubrivivax sp.]
MSPLSIDPAVFRELKGAAGAEFAVDLLGTFLDEAPKMFAELRAGLAAGSAERFRRAAHSLKANADTFGAAALGAGARALEQGGLPADDRGIAELETLFAQAAAALKGLAGA